MNYAVVVVVVENHHNNWHKLKQKNTENNRFFVCRISISTTISIYSINQSQIRKWFGHSESNQIKSKKYHQHQTPMIKVNKFKPEKFLKIFINQIRKKTRKKFENSRHTNTHTHIRHRTGYWAEKKCIKILSGVIILVAD